MLKNPLSYKFGSIIKKHEEVTELNKMNRVINKEIKISFFSKAISLAIIIVSFLVDFPTNADQWFMKGGEVFAIGIAAYALGIGISYGIKKKNLNRDKTTLEIEAKRKNLSLNKYINHNLTILLDSVEIWAKLHKIKYKHTRHNHQRHVIDFYDFPIDYIDVDVINYRIFFTIRINDLDLLNKIANDLPRSCNNLILVIDRYHIGPKNTLSIDEEGITSAKEMIVGIVLSNVYNTVYF